MGRAREHFGSFRFLFVEKTKKCSEDNRYRALNLNVLVTADIVACIGEG